MWESWRLSVSRAWHNACKLSTQETQHNRNSDKTKKKKSSWNTYSSWGFLYTTRLKCQLFCGKSALICTTMTEATRDHFKIRHSIKSRPSRHKNFTINVKTCTECQSICSFYILLYFLLFIGRVMPMFNLDCWCVTSTKSDLRKNWQILVVN